MMLFVGVRWTFPPPGAPNFRALSLQCLQKPSLHVHLSIMNKKLMFNICMFFDKKHIAMFLFPHKWFKRKWSEVHDIHLNRKLLFYFQKLLCMKRLFRARGRPEWPEQLACGEPRLCVCSPAPVQLTFPIKAPLVAIKAQNAKRGSLKWVAETERSQADILSAIVWIRWRKQEMDYSAS